MRSDFGRAAASARQSVPALVLLAILLGCGERIIVGRELLAIQTIDEPSPPDAGATPGASPDGAAGDTDGNDGNDDDGNEDDEDLDDEDDEDDDDDEDLDDDEDDEDDDEDLDDDEDDEDPPGGD